MRRTFWVALGLGAGAVSAVMFSRWLRRQKERYSPTNLGAQAAQGARDLGRLLLEALEEGRRAMADKEAEIRSSIPD